MCQSMAQEDTSSCQAIHGELHLQQKEIEGSILQELSLGTAEVQQELKVIFKKNNGGCWGTDRQDLWERPCFIQIVRGQKVLVGQIWQLPLLLNWCSHIVIL